MPSKKMGIFRRLSGPAQPQQPTTTSRIPNPFALGFFITLGGLFALALGLSFLNLSTIVIYIVFALFAALGLNPVVIFLTRRRLNRPWAIVLVYFFFALLMAGFLWLVIPTLVTQIAEFVQAVPGLISEFPNTDFYKWLESSGISIQSLLTNLENWVRDPKNISSVGSGVFSVSMQIASLITGLIIVLVLSLYFLGSLESMERAFYKLFPAHSRPEVENLTKQITDSVGAYLLGMVTLAFFNALTTFVLYTILGLPFPLLLTAVAFCITLIPLIGTVLFWAVGSLVALIDNPLHALIFAVLYLIYMQIEAYILTPRVMNRAISVPGSLVIIGALVGGTLLGLLGALVAIPVTASILLIIKQVLIPRQNAKKQKPGSLELT